MDPDDIDESSSDNSNSTPVVPPTGKIAITVGLFLFVLYFTNQGFADFVSKVLSDPIDETPTRGMCIQEQYDEGVMDLRQIPCWSAATRWEVVDSISSTAGYEYDAFYTNCYSGFNGGQKIYWREAQWTVCVKAKN